ncbi:MAG: EamA family transporter [Alphaproteobacteria bacterium]|nr:EamA family transporter [Alphaproteobacteria bacterium]
MVGAVLSLIAMAIAGRELATEISIFEIMFFRNAICLAIICLLVMRYGGHLFRTRRLRMHGFRNVVHFAAQAGWYYGLFNLPLSEVFAIEFTAPIWTAILAAMFLAEPLTRKRSVATLLGFIGILIILRPGVAIVDPAAFVVLGAAVGFAATFVITRSMASSDRPLTILFYMNLVQLPLSFVLMVPDWVMPSASAWPWIVMTGLAGLSSHYCFARAFALADAAIVAPIDFIRLPMAAFLGYFLYQEPTSLFVFLGAGVIFAGNLLNIRADRENR